MPFVLAPPLNLHARINHSSAFLFAPPPFVHTCAWPLFTHVYGSFANPDMVGHTGVLSAAIAACEAVDTCLGNLVASVKKRKGAIIVTADHGNCEKMWEDATGVPHTAHTLNKVPCILADYSEGGIEHKLRSGRLADLAPTLLQLLDVKQPSEMTGESLIIDPATIGQLQDGPMLTRPPLEGNPDSGTVPRNK